MADFGIFGGCAESSTYGAVTSGNTDGTDITPNATANTKGSWVELTASLDHDTTGGIIITLGSIESSTTSEGSYLVDIGIGGSGSEEVVLSNLKFTRERS
jgi:hypothetical protein